MDLGDLKVRISADISRLTSGVQAAQAQMQVLGPKLQSVGSSMQGVGTKMSLAVTAPLLLMGKIGLDELKSIEKANAQTGAALAQIGPKSRVSVKGVQALSEALQKKSGIDDQAIQSGANMLLQLGSLDTKTKAGAAAFTAATKAVVGYADFTGTDATAAGTKFAKSLASANQGTLELPRGVKLSGAAMKDLKSKFEGASTGAERQQVVADALSAKFAGLSRLTPTEKIALFTDKIAGLAAGIVSRLMPAMDPIIGVLDKAASWFDKLSPATQKWIAIIAVLAAALGPVLIIVGSIVSAIGALLPVIAAISAPVILVVAAIALLVAAFILAWRNSEAFRDGVIAAMEAMKAGVATILGDLKATISVWVAWAKSFWEAYGEQISAVAARVWSMIRQQIEGTLMIIKGVITTVLAVLRGDWSGAWEGIKDIANGVWLRMTALLGLQLGLIKDAASAAWNWVKTATSDKWNDAKDAALNAVKSIGGGLAGAASGIAGKLDDAFDAAIAKAKQIGGKIKDAVVDAVQGIAGAIRSIDLPDINIKMKEFKIPKGPSISVPSGISWNARGGIFDGPSVIGVGEAGSEAVVPLGGSAQNKMDRARIMRDAGLSGGSGIHQTFVFNTPQVDMFAASRAARFGMRAAGVGV